MAQASTFVGLALGSNIGDRLAALRAAVEAMRALVTIDKISPVYETAAAYITDQPPFLNAALTGTTFLTPQALLTQLKSLEIEIGRLPTFRYGPRLLDIDILFYGDQVLKQPDLTVPHPRMAERDFVMRPLADIQPDWQHPVTRLTARQMLGTLPASAAANLGNLLK